LRPALMRLPRSGLLLLNLHMQVPA